MELYEMCPAVCVQSTTIQITLLGIAFGLMSLFLFIKKPKKLGKSLKFLQIIFLILFLLFAVQINFISCGSGCGESGVKTELKVLPLQFLPYYSDAF